MSYHRPLYQVSFAAVAWMTALLNFAHAQDPLDSWARREVVGLTADLNAVAFGNGVLLAVGDGSTIARSTDGADWSVSTAGSYGDLFRVRFLDGEFVVVGSSDKILFSSDGTNWTERTLPSPQNWDVAYGNGSYVVVGAPATYVSTNRLDWTLTVPQTTTEFGLGTAHLDAVVFGNGRFVALSGGSSLFRARHSVYSSNGVDWVENGAAPTSNASGTGDLLFADGLFLGTGSDIPGVEGVMASSDGTSWCCRFAGGGSPTHNEGVGLTYGQGYYLYVKQPFHVLGLEWPFIFSSTDGMSWITRFSGGNEATKGQARGAAFGNGTFVVVGAAGYILQSGNLGGAPSIIHQPQDRGAVANNPATFSVQALGTFPLAYQWFHGESAIVDATNASYTIEHVAPSDSGGYHVVITNSIGSVTSRVAQLTVAFLDIKLYAGIEILGTVGRTYRIEATPADGPLNWQTMTDLVLPSTPYIWIDYGSPAAATRLYRASELP